MTKQCPARLRSGDQIILSQQGADKRTRRSKEAGDSVEDAEIVFLMGIEHMVLHAHADSLLNGGVGRMMTNSRCWTPPESTAS